MIRWSYLVPRLIVLGVLVAALWLGLNPLVRWLVVSAGETATTAKVEIGPLDVSLWRGQLRMQEVRVANPASPMKNLLEARDVALAVEPEPLLRRKVIVREARVSGLRFNTERETSGALDLDSEWLPGMAAKQVARLSQPWLAPLPDLLKQELARQVEQFESVRLARELAERWPAEYRQMEDRIDTVKGRIDRLRGLFERSSDDLLENLQAFQQGTAELRMLQQELAQLPGEVQRLKEQALRDKDAALAAKDKDLDRIARLARPETFLSPERLSEYLLGPDLGERVVTLVGWVRWGREHLPQRIEPPEAVRARGVDVTFPGTLQRPDFLIRRLVLDGEVRVGGQPLSFAGTATGLTAQPKVLGQPTVLRLQIQGKERLDAQITLDRTGTTPHDTLVVDCPTLRHPQQVLGDPEQFAVTVSPGNTHLWVSLDLRGDDLTGQLLVRQQPVEIIPQLGAKYGGERLAGNLREALRELRTIDVVVELSGKLEKPDWRLRSNLGPQLAEAVNVFLVRELEDRKQQLIALAEEKLREAMARLDQIVTAKQDELVAKLRLNDEEVQLVGRLIAERVPAAQQILGRKLSQGLPLQF